MTDPTSPSPAPETPEPSSHASGEDRRKHLIVSLLAACAMTAAVANVVLRIDLAPSASSVNADVSACLVVKDLVQRFPDRAGPPSDDELAAVSKAWSKDSRAQIPVTVRRDGLGAVRVVFPPDVANAHPGLARAYRNLGWEHLDRACPHSQAARGRMDALAAIPTASPASPASP